jgi:hypothetical protein
LTCWPEAVKGIATRARERRTAPEPVNFEEITKVRTRPNEKEISHGRVSWQTH